MENVLSIEAFDLGMQAKRIKKKVTKHRTLNFRGTKFLLSPLYFMLKEAMLVLGSGRMD